MLTSVGQAPFSQVGVTQPLYPSVSLQQSYIPPVQLPSAAPILSNPQLPSSTPVDQLTPPQFSVATPQLTPRSIQPTDQLTPRSTPLTAQEILYGGLTPRSAQQQQPNLMTSLQEEGRKLQPQVNNAIDRVSQEVQGFFRWLFAPIRH